MIIDMIGLSFRNLGRKKLRSILTILGVAVGVASVVVISSLGEIGKAAVEAEIDSLGVGGIMLSGNSRNPSAQLTYEHLEAVRSSGVVESAGPIIIDFTRSYMRHLMLDTVVWGIDYGAGQTISKNLLYGRMLTNNDISSQRRVCVVDRNVALAFYGRENIVGRTLSLRASSGFYEFEVVGVVESGGGMLQGLMGDVIPSFVYLPYTSMKSLMRRETFDQIAISVRPGVDKDVAGSQLLSALANVSGSARAGFVAENMTGQRQRLGGIMDIVAMLLSAIAGISVVVACISIMTVMLVSVNERTREIGIKKSIGASRGHIMLEFIAEAFSISLIGAVIGTAAGIIFVVLGSVFMDMPLFLSAGLIGFYMLFSVAVGVVFGVYPAMQAAKLSPVEALRSE